MTLKSSPFLFTPDDLPHRSKVFGNYLPVDDEDEDEDGEWVPIDVQFTANWWLSDSQIDLHDGIFKEQLKHDSDIS